MKQNDVVDEVLALRAEIERLRAIIRKWTEAVDKEMKFKDADRCVCGEAYWEAKALEQKDTE